LARDASAPRDEDERARFGAYALHLRAAEAVTLRCQLNQLLAGGGATRAVLLAGDLNDEVQAATTQILNGPPGSEIGTAGFRVPDRCDGDRMWNLTPLIPEAQRFRRIFRGRREVIDHIFAGRLLVTLATQVTTAIAAPGELRSITEHPGEEVGKAPTTPRCSPPSSCPTDPLVVPEGWLHATFHPATTAARPMFGHALRSWAAGRRKPGPTSSRRELPGCGWP
jgi:hypothetical protein